MKKLLITLFLIFGIATSVFAAYENFTTGWTETDPNNHLSQSATRSTFADFNYNEVANLAKNDGINFTGDWDVAFDFNIADTSQSLTDTNQSTIAFANSDNTLIQNVVLMESADGTKVHAGLLVVDELFNIDQTFNDTLSLNTTYYARFKRDDDAGTNGTLYLDVFASDANRRANTSPLVQLSLPITVMGKVDMVNAYCPISIDFDNTVQTDGYIENLDLAYVPTSIKTINGLAKASVKTINGLAIANVKSWNGLQ
jgi:hypothetical protein